MAYLDHRLAVLSGQSELHHPEGCHAGCELDKLKGQSPLVSGLIDGLYLASVTGAKKIHVREVFVRKAASAG